MNAIALSTGRLPELLPPIDSRSGELIEREGRIERAQRNAYYEIGLELKAIRDGGLYKVEREQPIAGRFSWLTFEEYVGERWEVSQEKAYKLIYAAEAAQKLSNCTSFVPAKESHVRPLLALESDAERAAVWQEVIRERAGEPVRASDVEAAVERYRAAKSKDWVTLDEWQALESDERRTALSVRSESVFNKQDNDSIEWAQWSWNPITGCKHDCPYCYARDLADRFYPQKFEPTLLAGRLAAPLNTKVPARAATDIAYRNVFTCSMADLFGRWVPKEWIDAVLDTVRANSQWNFLFLTKFPKRMAEFDIPPNAWMGTTVDCQVRVKAAEDAFERINCDVKWVSLEPLLEPLKFTRLELFDWVVLGGASKSTQTPGWVPPMDWVAALHVAARAAGCRIYYKSNIGMTDASRLREFPWQEPASVQLPKSFIYLKTV